MFAGNSCESQSSDFGSSAMALAGDRILDQNDPSSPLNQPPPPPPEEEEPPPPPPAPPPAAALSPEKLGKGEWREPVRKKAEAAAEETATVVDRVLRREELKESVLSSEEEER